MTFRAGTKVGFKAPCFHAGGQGFADVAVLAVPDLSSPSPPPPDLGHLTLEGGSPHSVDSGGGGGGSENDNGGGRRSKLLSRAAGLAANVARGANSLRSLCLFSCLLSCPGGMPAGMTGSVCLGLNAWLVICVFDSSSCHWDAGGHAKRSAAVLCGFGFSFSSGNATNL